MNTICIKILRFYQKVFSPDRGFLVKLGIKNPGNNCVFYPSCSEYSVLAYEKYGFFKASFLTVKRIFRCHPWQKNNVDFP